MVFDILGVMVIGFMFHESDGEAKFATPHGKTGEHRGNVWTARYTIIEQDDT